MFKVDNKVVYYKDYKKKNAIIYIVSRVRSIDRVDLTFLDGSVCTTDYYAKYLRPYKIIGEQLLFSFMDN